MVLFFSFLFLIPVIVNSICSCLFLLLLFNGDFVVFY